MKNIEQLQLVFKNYAANQQFTQTPTELYEPLNYILALGGKAMRPALLLAGCQLFSDDITPALAAAFGVELFHNFSLMHDDIMDNAATRRGKATVHEYYNNNTAILSGDVMLVYAYQYVSKVPERSLASVFRVFNQTAIGVCEGQRYDINFETQAQVAIADYLRMIELKTAVLLSGALQIGALVAGADEQQCQYLGEFGRNMGIAFQLQDDYLDTFGDAAKFGKRIGGDIVQNKKTYLYLRALELANAEQLQQLKSLYNQTVPADQEAAKIAAVTALFRDLGIPMETQKIMEHYHQTALAALSNIAADMVRKQPLLDMAAQLLGREV